VRENPAFKLLILFVIVFYSFDANCQQSEQDVIDSLRIVNQEISKQRELVDNYNRIAMAFGAINIDSSLHYSNKSRILAIEINYPKGLAVSHSYTARASIQTSNLKAAIENFHLALDIFKQENDSINILDTYSGLSYVSSYGSSQLKTLNYNLEALAYAEALKDTLKLSIIYNNIGAVYKRLKNYDPALKYFQKSLNLDLPKGNPTALATGYSNIGVLKVEHGKFQEAGHDYKMVRRFLPKVNSEYLKAYLHVSLSGYYNGIDELDSCQYHINKAYEYSIDNKYPHIRARVDKRHGELLLKKKQYQKSIKLFQESLDRYTQLGLQEEFPTIYKLQAEAYSKLGLYPEAFEASRKENLFIDSLQRTKVTSIMDEFEEQNRKDEFARLNLEQALKDQQIENTKIQMDNRTNLGLISISLLVIIIGIIVYFYIKTKESNLKLQESEDSLKSMNASKDKFFSIISHDLKSPFNAIVGFSNELSNSYDDYSNDQRKMMIGIIKETSDSALSLLDNLLTWARSQSGFIQFNPEKIQLHSLVETSISPYMGAAKMKNLRIQNLVAEDCEIYADKETTQIVISNLFNNAIKYNNTNGEIIISSISSKNHIEICIADTGIGMSEKIKVGLFKIEENVQRPGTSEEEGTGLGLILCKEFVSKNGGDIRVESEVNSGSSFYFTLPTA
jgi:signal transduction histidine kinase